MHLSHGLVPALAVLAGAQNFTFQAEDGVLTGVTVEKEQPGYTGISHFRMCLFVY